MNGVIWLPDSRFMLVHGSDNTIIEAEDLYMYDFDDTDFGKIYGDNTDHIFAVVDSALTLFNKTDFSVYASSPLPDGDIIDLNFTPNGISLLMNNGGQKTALIFDLDLNRINELSADINDRWEISQINTHNQRIFGLGHLISNRPVGTILHNLETPIDFNSGNDVAISDFVLEVTYSGPYDSNAFIEYSFLVSNLTEDTIFSAVIQSDVLAGQFCYAYRISEPIDSTTYLMPFESRPYSGSRDLSLLYNRRTICMHVSIPNGQADPFIENNIDCTDYIVLTYDDVKVNNINVYRTSDPTHVTINLNDFSSDHLLHISIYNNLGQLITRSELSSGITKVETPNLGNNLYFYQIRDKKGRIKTGKLF